MEPTQKTDGSAHSEIKTTERAFLADVATQGHVAIPMAHTMQLSASMFSDPAAANAWELVEKLPVAPDANPPVPDSIRVYETIIAALGLETGDDRNAFLDLLNTTEGNIRDRLIDIVLHDYCRKVMNAVRETVTWVQNMPRHASENLGEFIKIEINKVPKPDFSELLGFAPSSEAVEMPAEEIPEELLHVPGFIDELVTYSLQVAYRPNRTLCFAGALALLAHLMGRTYTDRRETRSNLYVLALAPSGGGKESPRKVNRKVLSAAKCARTCLDQVGSGEGLEDLLQELSACLVQMDEIQTTFNSLKQSTNSVAQGIYRYLLTFYSASGSDHTTRIKAKNGRVNNDSFSVIHDPSLTLFGTGVPHGFYRSLTEESLENGLAGRCLVFQTNVKAEANDFDGDRPDLPPLVVQFAAERATAMAGGNWRELPEGNVIKVPYAAGVNERLREINKEADGLSRVCERESDTAGAAIWTRAPDKVGKLALIYSVSENFAQPTITLEGVNWAWELVKTLNRLFIDRVHLYMSNDKINDLCNNVIAYLEKHPQGANQRDIARKFNLKSDEMAEVRETLEMRGQITVQQGSKSSLIYKLAPDYK